MGKRATATVLMLGGVLVGCSSTAAPGTPGPESPLPYAYFYVNPDNGGTIFGVPAGSDKPVALMAGDDAHSVGLGFAFDRDNLYFADVQSSTGPGSPEVGALLARPRAGGPSRVIVDHLAELSPIALDDDFIYFVNTDWFADTFFIGSVPKAGGAVQHVADFTLGLQPTFLAAAGGFVYWTQADGQVLRAAATGGAPVVLASGETRPLSIAAGASGVYWLNGGHSGIDCTPTDGEVRGILAGQAQPVTLASAVAGAAYVAVNGSQVFWSTLGAYCNIDTQGLGAVVDLSLGGAAPQTLASGLLYPADLFADPPVLHFTSVADFNTGTLAPASAAF